MGVSTKNLIIDLAYQNTSFADLLSDNNGTNPNINMSAFNK